MTHDNPEPRPAGPMTDREAYNLVTDTVTGVNIRSRDNLAQAIAVLVCAPAGVLIGLALARDPLIGGIAGGVGGAMAAIVLTGGFIMIRRGLRHLRGRHD
jgi:hypothetical protein